MNETIVFIDEIDALATSRGNIHMHEATRQILSVLLRRLDGFTRVENGNIFNNFFNYYFNYL